MSPPGKEQKEEKEKRHYTVPKHYKVPRKPVAKALEALDNLDCPDKPGMVYETTLKAMVDRFYEVFGDKSEAASKLREKQIEQILDHMRRHTRRRRGDALLNDGFLEWEQTSRVYELFAVQLNIFERIFFTVDVSETTSLLSQLVSTFLVLMIFLSIICWMISTLPFPPFRYIDEGCVGVEKGDCAPIPAIEFTIIEQLSVIVFTIEYLVRLLTVHSVRFELLNDPFLEDVLSAGEIANSRDGGGGGGGGGSLKNKKAAMKATKSKTMTDFDPSKAASSASLSNRQSNYQVKQLDGKFMTVMKHTLGPSNLIDLAAILPFWIELLSGSEESEGGALMVLRILRLTRVFRVFKLGKYNEVFTLFARVITQSMPALLLMLFFIWLGCCLFGTLIWFAEQGSWYPPDHVELLKIGITGRGAYLRTLSDEHPEQMGESPFHSIVHSFWYVIVTITTVGYGDVSPTTALGKCIAVTSILNGIIVLAMPIGVVGANFSQEYYRVMEEKKKRARLKQELETQAAVEAEQDNALRGAAGGEEDDTGSDATELRRIDDARQAILQKAQDFDKQCADSLGERSPNFCMALRHFVKNLLVGGSMETVEVIVTSPILSPTILADLDVLNALLYDTIMAVMSVKADADFGVEEAFDMRHNWNVFVEGVWKYVMELCRVVAPQEPPEYFQLKAHIGRLALSASQANKASPRTQASTGESSQGIARKGGPVTAKLSTSQTSRAESEGAADGTTSRETGAVASDQAGVRTAANASRGHGHQVEFVGKDEIRNGDNMTVIEAGVLWENSPGRHTDGEGADALPGQVARNLVE